MKHRSRTAYIGLVSTERDHLFHIGTVLAGGIGPAFLQNAAKPVIISVRGTLAGGKKIFPDAAVQSLFGISDARRIEFYRKFRDDRPRFSGRQDYDEYWKGRHQDGMMEIAFINLAYGHNYGRIKGLESLPFGDRENIVAKKFLELREHGGLAFVHNGYRFLQTDPPDIDIWLEGPGRPVGRDGVNDPPVNESRMAPGELQKIFNRLVCHEEWARYVGINVKNPDLLQSPRFRKALGELRSRGPLFV